LIPLFSVDELCGYVLDIYDLRIYRCNTSLLIDYCRSDGNHSYILIDVGKTFREQVLRWFTFYKIPRVDSVRILCPHVCDYL
jgi:hypothetical protein